MYSFAAQAELPNFVSLAKKVNPAIVNISTKQNPTWQGRNRDPMLDFLERYYGIPPQGSPEPIQSLGSGFIIEASGLIITNNHVVDKADEIEVQLANDDKKYQAQVIGKDPKTDIALIKINAGKKLPYIQLGSSSKLEVGEWVAAFGNPLGFTHSITKGIISAKGRDVDELGIFPFIQTDASINPGNSGGPLVNLNGEVVGVNTFIIRGAQGLGFAVPIDGVKEIIPELKSKGSVTRGYLGISYSPVDQRIANYLGLKEPKGAVVGDVAPGSPADQAGIKTYDVILKYGTSDIDSPSALSAAVAKQKLGTKVKVKIWRNGKTRSLSVVSKAPPSTKQNATSIQNVNAAGEKAPYNLGFKYATLNKKVAKDLGLRQTRGIVITDVVRDSAAFRAGLNTGDIILDINRKRARKLSDINKYLKNGNNLMRVQRGEYRVAIFIGN